MQELTDKLYNEGLSKGKQEGEAIVKEAASKADRILDDARAEAARIIAEAKKQAEELQAKVRGDIRLAAGQSIQSTRQEIENLLVSKVADAEITGALTSADFVKQVIMTVAKAFSPDNADFHYTADDLMHYFCDKDIATLLLVNPDNPSGNFIGRDDVLKLSQWSHDRNVRLIVDESFVDFSTGFPDNTLLDDTILESNPNLIVVKSISKSFGVPGLRLGVIASSDIALISRIKKDVSIWNINSFAEFFMQIYTKYEKDYHRAAEKFQQERQRFYEELSKIPFLRVIPSEANYFLCEVLPPYTSHGLTEKLLSKHNILIKDCSMKKGFNGRNYIRIAIRNTKNNDYLINCMATML